MNFKVVKTLSGKIRVKYTCPHCGESLESELAEAGSRDTCPQCQNAFVVPGEAQRKEFEAQLRQQLEAKKEAERQRLAEVERQRIADAAALAEREAERAAEKLSVQPGEPAAAAYVPPALPRRNRGKSCSAPENTHYPALEFYIGVLRICGWLCVGLFGLYVIFGGLAFALMPVMSDGEVHLGASILTFLVTLFPAALSTLLPALMLFVWAQLLQLALDARRDLAKLVAHRGE